MRPLNHQPVFSNAALKSMLPAIERNRLDMNSLVTLFEHFPLGILISETNDKCLYRNPAYQLMLGQDVNDPAMTGWPRKSVIGMSLVKVFKVMDTHSRPPAKNPADEAIQKNRKVVLQHGHTLISRQGRETALEHSASPIHDNHGAVIGAVLVFHHEVRSKAMLSKITQLAWYDYLTGLPNYALFTERLTQAIAMAERHRRRMAVLFLDMDGFKRINDSPGHLWGIYCLNPWRSS